MVSIHLPKLLSHAYDTSIEILISWFCSALSAIKKTNEKIFTRNKLNLNECKNVQFVKNSFQN